MSPKLRTKHAMEKRWEPCMGQKGGDATLVASLMHREGESPAGRGETCR